MDLPRESSAKSSRGRNRRARQSEDLAGSVLDQFDEPTVALTATDAADGQPFDVVRRGWDPDQVQLVIARLQSERDALVEQLANRERTGTSDPSQTPPGEAASSGASESQPAGDASSGPDAYAHLGHEVAQVLRSAHDTVSATIAQAERDAAALLERAGLQAQEIVEDAEQQSFVLVTRAREQVAGETDRAQEMLAAARRESDDLIGAARQQLRDLQAAACRIRVDVETAHTAFADALVALPNHFPLGTDDSDTVEIDNRSAGRHGDSPEDGDGSAPADRQSSDDEAETALSGSKAS